MVSLTCGSVRFRVLVPLMALMLCSARHAVAQTYTLTNLGDLGGGFSEALAVNKSGQVVGWADTADGTSHAFLWQNGVMTDIGTLGGESQAYGINDSGQITGYSYLADGITFRAFLWQNGVMTDLGTLGGGKSYASGINNSGQVVGYSYLADGITEHAFLWQNGVMTDIGTLGGESFASGINNSGQVVGSSYLADGVTEHAFLWQNGVMSDLGTFGGDLSQAYGINATGQVVGYSTVADGDGVAFLWQNGSTTDLGALPGGGGTSEAYVINAAGQVVGSSSDPDGNNHAVLWQNSAMTDLNDLISAGSGWLLKSANDVNEAGQIVGGGGNPGAGITGAFLLTPGPTANSQSVSVLLGTPAIFKLSGSDYQNPPPALTFAILTQPENGDLTGLNISTGAVTYTPKSGFRGTDSFTFTVSDGTHASNPANVTLIVAPGTPTANAQTISIAHSTQKSITLTGTDPDVPAMALTFVIVEVPKNGTLGTLNKTTGTVTYTPNASFQGTDTFTFTVSNGTNTSAASTVTLKVATGTPKANAQTLVVTHNAIADITLTGTDPDVPALALTFAIVVKPTNGTLSTLNNTTGAVTYTPKASFQGTDTFTFTVSNGTNTSAVATVTLKVAPGTPKANAQTVAVTHSMASAITLTGTDPDVPALALTFAIVAAPKNGTLGSLNKTTGAVTYTPKASFQGTDTFTFTASNGINISVAATVTLKVAPGTPKANAQTIVVAHNNAAFITLAGTDPDVPALALTFAIVATPKNGTLGALNKTTGAVTYTPKASFQGSDIFTFTASNGTNTSAVATVTLKVTPGSPTGKTQTVNVALSTAVKITLTGTDPDVPVLPLTFAIATNPAHGVLGSLNASTGVVTYTPNSKYDGTDSFMFTVGNGTNTSVPTTITLKVGGG